MIDKTERKRTFSLSEVAQRLGISSVNLRRAVRDGMIPVFRPYPSETPHGKYLMCWPDLVEFIGEKRARFLFPEASPEFEETQEVSEDQETPEAPETPETERSNHE